MGLRRAGSLTALLYSLLCAHAVAHPLGNFTINHLAAVRTHSGGLNVHYVLDIAEIPAFQIMHAGGGWTTSQKQAWIAEEAARVASGLFIQSGNDAMALHLDRASATTRPGAGGLPTLYWTGDYTATVPRDSQPIAITDRVYADRRIGWKDIVLPGQDDPTDALRTYPNALIGSPRHNDRATFDLLPDGRVTHVVVSGQDAADWGVASIARSSALSDLFSRAGQTPLLILLTLLAAFGLGALHGLEPGHGKALLAFTLVGARATFKQAIILAGALTLAHTVAVLALGLVLFFAAGFATETIFTWITLVSGAAVAIIGARSLASAVARARNARAAGSHTHEADGHLPAHGHDDSHAHARSHSHPHPHAEAGTHGHSHAIPGTAPLHFPSAVVAAMSGGIAPCPAAIVVLLTAMHLHRIGYGLLLIVIFSLGLAAILTGLGLAVVHGAAWLQQRSGFARLAGIAPFITACVISIIGATMLAQGLIDHGIRLPGIAVVAMTLLAIGAFALIPRYRHAAFQTA